MDQLLQKENDFNNSNRQSTLDTNKNNIIFCNSGNYFSFGKDNSLSAKITPNTSSFNIKENLKKSVDNVNLNINNNSFLNKKRKLMTSEELELEQIERERKEVKKMMQKNMALYYRTKSGTTTIVSKIRENIYNTNTNNTNNNINKNAILNNYINTNKNTNINTNNKFNAPANPIPNKNNSYVMNFMKEKGINKIEDFHKVIHQSIKKPEMVEEPEKEKIVEIINTDIPIKNKDSVNNGDKEENEGNIINLNEEKEKEEENSIKEKDEEKVENEPEKENIQKEETIQNSNDKTPYKESSYLLKMKQLGSMSKLSLCNKIQKYTEICQEVLKEQDNDEESKEVKKNKKGKGKKKNKKSRSTK